MISADDVDFEDPILPGKFMVAGLDAKHLVELQSAYPAIKDPKDPYANIRYRYTDVIVDQIQDRAERYKWSSFNQRKQFIEYLSKMEFPVKEWLEKANITSDLLKKKLSPELYKRQLEGRAALGMPYWVDPT